MRQQRVSWVLICGGVVACALEPLEPLEPESGATGGQAGSAGTSASGASGGVGGSAAGVSAGGADDGIGPAGWSGSSPGGGSNGLPPAAGGPDGPCEPNPCISGTCSAQGTTFMCTCQAGFSGTLCELAPGSCSPNPCRNGGSCSERGDNYTCACASGFTGAACELNIDDCASASCRNGGSCEDEVDGYRCSCASGWEGATCEVDVDECEADPCENGGTCTDGLDAFRCTCPAGWGGLRCEINADDCLPNSCLNGGVCLDGLEEATCMCPAAFDGPRCEFGTLSVDATDRGWYDDTGHHEQEVKNTLTGRANGVAYNSYLTFRLPDFDGTVLDAVLILEHEGYVSPDASEQFSIWDVTTSSTALGQSNDGAVSIFADLGGGVRYATFGLSFSTQGQLRDIPLGPDAQSAIGAARGGSFSLGFKLDTDSSDDDQEYARWSTQGEPRTHRLVLTIDK